MGSSGRQVSTFFERRPWRLVWLRRSPYSVSQRTRVRHSLEPQTLTCACDCHYGVWVRSVTRPSPNGSTLHPLGRDPRSRPGRNSRSLGSARLERSTELSAPARTTDAAGRPAWVRSGTRLLGSHPHDVDSGSGKSGTILLLGESLVVVIGGPLRSRTAPARSVPRCRLEASSGNSETAHFLDFPDVSGTLGVSRMPPHEGIAETVATREPPPSSWKPAAGEPGPCVVDSPRDPAVELPRPRRVRPTSGTRPPSISYPGEPGPVLYRKRERSGKTLRRFSRDLWVIAIRR
jgi:hypothetical protein